MLFQNTVFEPDNGGCYPSGGPSHPREAAMRYDVITFCNDELVLIVQRFRHRADEIEQPFATWCYVCAVLNVVRVPEALCRRVVTLVEQCVEGFYNERLIFGFDRLT